MIGAVTDPRGSSRRNVARFASPWTVSRRQQCRGVSSGGRPVERRSAPPSVVHRSRHRCSIGSPQAISPMGSRRESAVVTAILLREGRARGRGAFAALWSAPGRLKHEAQPRASPVRSSKDGSPSERGHDSSRRLRRGNTKEPSRAGDAYGSRRRLCSRGVRRT